jgi:acetyltransferase-like isoleucine patch superfamily enzyme
MKQFYSFLKELLRLIRRKYNFLAGIVEIDNRLSIGLNTYGVGEHTVLLFRDDDRVEIGKYCSIAYGVTIVASGEHNYRAVANYPFYARFIGDGNRDTYSNGPVRIGNDVWIGAKAIILSGVAVGDGAVIAAGAVVVADVLPYSIVGGVPARVIKYRFRPEVIQRLLEIRWWDWEPEFVRKNIELFYSDVDAFITVASSVASEATCKQKF